MATKGIMKVSNEVVSIAGIQGHESPPHDDEFDFVSVVTQAL